jgi:hypothetical protein
MELKAFRERPLCKKCGSTSVIREYCTAYHIKSEGSREIHNVSFNVPAGDRVPEHIDVYCARCYYSWLMEVFERR